MARYKFDIPPRMKKKNGLFGELETIDIVLTGILVLFGIIIMLLFKSLLSFIIAGLSFGVAYFVFIMPFRYEDNLRKWIVRERNFNSKPKKYIFIRKPSNYYMYYEDTSDQKQDNH